MSQKTVQIVIIYFCKKDESGISAIYADTEGRTFSTTFWNWK